MARGTFTAPGVSVPIRVEGHLDEAAPLHVLGEVRVAIVGARAATGYGELIAHTLAEDLADVGGVSVVVKSAYGIGGAALRGALAAGGSPIVVTAGGLNRRHLAGLQSALDRVADAGGVIVTACQDDDSAPNPERHHAALDLIAELADLVVVVEAGHVTSTASLIDTAERAGKTIAAVPGPTTSPASVFPHAMIRAGRASLVTGAQDVVRLIETIRADRRVGARTEGGAR